METFCNKISQLHITNLQKAKSVKYQFNKSTFTWEECLIWAKQELSLPFNSYVTTLFKWMRREDRFLSAFAKNHVSKILKPNPRSAGRITELEQILFSWFLAQETRTFARSHHKRNFNRRREQAFLKKECPWMIWRHLEDLSLCVMEFMLFSCTVKPPVQTCCTLKMCSQWVACYPNDVYQLEVWPMTFTMETKLYSMMVA